MTARLLTLLAGTFAVATTALAAAPEREEFAYEAPVLLHGSASIYRAPVTLDVYRGVTRTDLGDLRVYNAAGEIVPHGLMRPRAEPATTRVKLPLFPLPIAAGPEAGDLSVHVKIARDGSIVDVRGSDGATSQHRAYVVDASGLEHPISVLEVAWSDTAADSIRQLQVEASDDLRNWRFVGKGALAKLERDGQLLERRRVEFPARKVKYLRLSWVAPSLPAAIEAVTAEYDAKPAARREWFVATRATSDDSREQRFALKSQVLVDRARIVLPPNSVARVVILYRNKDGDPWRHVGAKTVYTLTSSNGTIEDRELRLNRAVSATQWLLRFSEPVGGEVDLELGWLPHELVFLPRGNGPFRVAYGLAGLTPANSGMHELIRLSLREDSGVDMGRASLGPRQALRGEAARKPGWSLSSWKHWLLWAVLLAGVGALCFLALRLARQIRITEET